MLDLLERARSLQQKSKLVAPNTRHEVLFSENPVKPIGELTQTFVSRRMTKLVIDRLEMVEIDQRKSRDRHVTKLVLGEFMATGLEHTSVCQTRKGITLGKLPQ